MVGKWRIVLAEQNMDLGSVDRAVFGMDTCHSFLALINPENDVVAELHGTTYHPQTDKLMHKGQSLPSYMGVIASSVNLLADFEDACRYLSVDEHFPRLKAVNANGAWRSNLAQSMQLVLEADKHSVLSKWLDGCAFGRKMNELDIFYTPISIVEEGRQNCNAVTRSMLHAMDIEIARDNFDLMPHGYKNKLWENSLIGEFNTKGIYSMDAIDSYLGHVQNYITRDMPKIVNDELDMRSIDLTRRPVLAVAAFSPK